KQPAPPSSHGGTLAGHAQEKAIDALVLKALAKEPDQRWASMAAFADAACELLARLDPTMAALVRPPKLTTGERARDAQALATASTLGAASGEVGTDEVRRTLAGQRRRPVTMGLG